MPVFQEMRTKSGILALFSAMIGQRLILRELHCPRCNAIAQLRVEEEREVACIVYIVCRKCKLTKYYGITTRKAINLMSKEEKLVEMLSRSKSKSEQQRLLAKLKKIREEIRRATTGFGG